MNREIEQKRLDLMKARRVVLTLERELAELELDSEVQQQEEKVKGA